MANPSGRGGFTPGQSGNPRGRRPNVKSWAEKLRRGLAGEHKPGQTNQERIVEVIIEQAKHGSMEAVKWIADRVDGKVVDAPPAEGGPPSLQDNLP